MLKMKKIAKRTVIIYVIFYVLMCSMATNSYATQYYDSSCGQYLADYAREFIETYGADSNYGGASQILYRAESTISWGGGSFGNGTFWSCCTSGVWYMYLQALGIDIYDLGYSADSRNDLYLNNEYFEWHAVSAAQPGDILVKAGHVELVLTEGATEHANFGHYSQGYNCNVHSNCNNSFECVIRLRNTVEVNTSGAVSATINSTASSSNKMSNFFFSGIADGEYSAASHTNWLDEIINTITQVASFLIGLIPYVIRIALVGWISIFDNLFNWSINAITSTNTDSSDMGITSTEVTTDDETRITMETILYNDLDLIDINIFE